MSSAGSADGSYVCAGNCHSLRIDAIGISLKLSSGKVFIGCLSAGSCYFTAGKECVIGTINTVAIRICISFCLAAGGSYSTALNCQCLTENTGGVACRSCADSIVGFCRYRSAGNAYRSAGNTIGPAPSSARFNQTGQAV